jgi:hypothetical protein
MVRCRRLGGSSSCHSGSPTGASSRRQDRRDVGRERRIEREKMGRDLLRRRARIVAFVDAEVALEELDEGPIGDACVIRLAAPPEVDQALVGAPPRELEEKARLADSRLADRGDELTSSLSRFSPSTLERGELTLASDERSGIPAQTEAMLVVRAETAAASGSLPGAGQIVDDESRAEERPGRLADEDGVRPSVRGKGIQHRDHSAFRIGVDPASPADFSHQTLIRVNGDRDHCPSGLGLAVATEGVQDGHGGQGRSSRRVFGRVEAKGRDESRGPGLLDAPAEAFDLLHKHIKMAAELGRRVVGVDRSSAGLKHRHQPILPSDDDGR